jgi:hypothetical protein
MSNEASCPSGSPDCEFGDTHEMALTEKIMHMIGRYNDDAAITPCPECLRDTMLSMAALLQLEAARLDSANRGKPLIKGKRFDEQFAEAARDRMQAVIETVVGNVVPFSDNEGRFGKPRQPGRGW